MIYRIPKGWHNALPLYTWLWCGKQLFEWEVEFTDSCRYDLQTDDQLDTNKLVGIGYLPGGHHQDSARFGWRYNKDTEQIELLAYVYASGQRTIMPIASIPLNEKHKLRLAISEGSYYFKVMSLSRRELGVCGIAHLHDKALQYLLLPYFGGNRKAPHTTKIHLKRL